MLVVIAYDIRMNGGGARRTYRISRICGKYGVCVQKSVFECEIDADQFRRLQKEITDVMDPVNDSIRYYCMGNHYHQRRIVCGIEKSKWDKESYIL